MQEMGHVFYGWYNDINKAADREIIYRMEMNIYRTFPSGLKEEWNELLAQTSTHVPFLRYEYIEAWWNTRGGGEWPQEAQLAIVTAREEGRLVGIAPLFLTTWQGEPTLLLVGSIEISDYLDLIARDGDMPNFVCAMFDVIEKDETFRVWKRFELYNVLETSATFAALENCAHERGWEYALESFRPAMTVSLPGDWEAYLAGIDKKQRHEIRRKMRRAQASDRPVRWYYVQDPETLESEIEAFLTLMSYDEEKARFLTPPMRENFRNTMRCAFEEGCLQLAFLEIDGRKAAGYVSLDYLDQVWVYNSGIDPEFNEYSPGWVLLGELLKWANEHKYTAFDFMRGDEEYKIRFGAHRREVMRAIVTRP